MSCSKFKVIGIPALNEVINREVGNDIAAYTSLVALTNNRVYKELIVRNNVNANEDPETAYKLLLKAKEIVLGEVSNKVAATSRREKGYFGSYEARQTALNYCAAKIAEYNFVYTKNGDKFTFETLQKRLNSDVVKLLENRAKSIANTKNIMSELEIIIKEEGASRFDKLTRFVLQHGSIKDKNYAALARSLATNDANVGNPFLEDLLLRKNVANIFRKKINYQHVDFQELGGYIEEIDSTKDDDGIDDSVDAMAINWLANVGELTDYNKHIEEVVRYRLSYIPKLLSAEPVKNVNGKPKYSVDLSNELGTPSYLEYDFILKLLYSSTNPATVDTFIESIKTIANNVEGAEGLITLYDDLNSNRNLAYKFMMVFNKPIIRKFEVYLDSIGENKNINARISNTNSIKRTILANDIYSAIKNSTVSRPVEKLRALYALARGSYNVANLYNMFKLIYPEITEKAVAKLVDEIGVNEVANYIVRLSQYVSRTINAYDSYQKGEIELPSSFVPAEAIVDIDNLSNLLEDKLFVPIELNSRNVEGNLTSDVINQSYITILDNIIHGVYGQDAIKEFIEQKFVSNQYEFSNYLLEHKENDAIVNYGIFRKNDAGGYELTEYGADMFHSALFSGISDHDTVNNQLYNEMSDGDYTLTAIGAFLNPVYKDPSQRLSNAGVTLANYMLPIPSDAPKNFVMSGARYGVSGLSITGEDGVKRVNRNHPLYKQFFNIAMQEITDMAQAVNVMLKCDVNGVPIIETSEDGNMSFVYSEEYKNTPNRFYKHYHYKDGKAPIAVDNEGNTVLTGQIFNFNRLKSKVTPKANAAFANLIGVNGTLDFLYGGSREVNSSVRYVNGKVELNQQQEESIAQAVEQFVQEYSINASNHILAKYGTFINNIFTDQTEARGTVAEFLLNSYLMYNTMADIYIGNPAYYKNPQTLLKRAKEAQASGSPFGISNHNSNTLRPSMINEPVKINGKQLIINGKEVRITDKFNAITILNTRKGSRKKVVDTIKEQLKIAGLSKSEIERIIAPFIGNTATNDAQSYITFEEWVRRITVAGELEKYSSLIEALNSDKDLSEIDFTEFGNRVQVQKNIYFDHGYDSVIGREAPRQIKNAEFVLIPKLIKGTDLEAIYNIMSKHNIHQLNTDETVKAGWHNATQLWDNEGVLTDESLKNFEDNVSKYVESYSYNYLYRQQEVPQHIEDAENKAGIQVMKKIIDNLSNNSDVQSYKKAIFDNYVANIKAAFDGVCKELGIPQDINGNIELNEDGSIKAFNRQVFFAKFREQAAQQGLDDALIECFNVDASGIPNIPLWMNNIASKLESIVNGYLNSEITRETISGWHAAQVADFGFNRLGTNNKHGKEISTDPKLGFKVIHKAKEGVYGDIDIYHAEIYLPRWSKKLAGAKLTDLSDELRTMIGYRIPTEGKQSMVVMKVVPYPGSEDGFLPSAYGSTIVVPDEWVTQTGSDFDVDSVYGMSKRFIKVNNQFIPYRNERYTSNTVGYLNYLKDNIGQVVKESIGKTFINQGSIVKITNDKIKSLDGAIASAEIAKVGKKELNKLATEHGVISYDSYISLPVEERSSKAARDNAIIENFIKILNHPEAFEENTTTSNFDVLSEVEKEYRKLAGVTAEVQQFNDFITQVEWFAAATSGIKIKGISVNRDTFMSISNVTKAYHKTGIKVAYSTEGMTDYARKKRLSELRDRYEEVEYDKDNNRIIVSHKTFGWSKDNKNVDGYLTNPYSSQTTAHILDVMKSGAVHNENTYTFNAFKTIVDLGSNYDTAIGFMWQPAMDIIVSKWKEGNSVSSDKNINPITEAIREIAAEVLPKMDMSKLGRDAMLKALTKYYAKNDRAKQMFGTDEKGNLSLSDGFYSTDLMFSSSEYKSRLEMAKKGKKDLLFDLFVVAQFNRLNNIGQDVSNNLNVLTADKYGAKQSAFSTREVFNNAVSAIVNTEIYSGKDALLTAVFPGFKGELSDIVDNVLKTDINDSKYKSLAAFLKYSTVFAVKVNAEIFDTANPEFDKHVRYIKQFLGQGRFTEEIYNNYKKFLISKLIASNDNNPYLNLPITVVDGMFAISKAEVVNTAEAKRNELSRLAGINITETLQSINIANKYEPKQEEIDKFSKLTPAQKIIYINNEFPGELFAHYVSTNLEDTRDVVNGKLRQYLRFNQGNASTNDVHRHFAMAFNSPNPLIKLAAADLVKYAYMIEGNNFKAGSISRMIGNVPFDSYYEGGMNLGYTAKQAMYDMFKIAPQFEDVVSYLRTNYYTANVQKTNFKKLISSGHPVNNLGLTKIYYIQNEDARIVARELLDVTFTNDEQYGALSTIIRADKKLWVIRADRTHITVQPIGPAANFEFDSSYENSIIYPKGAGLAQSELAINEYNDWHDNIVIPNYREFIKDNLPRVESAKFIGRLNSGKYNDVIAAFKSNIKHQHIYNIDGFDYLGIVGEAALRNSKELKAYRDKYPGTDINDYQALIKLLPEDYDNNEDSNFSSVDDSPVGRSLKEAADKIRREVSRGNLQAQNVMRGLRQAGVTEATTEALTDNSDYSANIIADYITVESDQIIYDINRFMPVNLDEPDGEQMAIDDDRVIDMVLKDYRLQDKFLRVILNARSFKDKYRTFNDIDENNIDDSVRKSVESIKKAIERTSNNTEVINARNKWLKQFILKHSNNPNVNLGIMNEMDVFGDTSFLDYYIQDIRSNKSLIIQNVIKLVDAQIEKARLDGIEAVNEFNNTVNDIIKRAAENGIKVSLNDVISNGRIIQPNDESWNTKREELDKEVKIALQIHGKNSYEHLVAKNKLDLFLAKTTISKTKTVEIPNFGTGTNDVYDYRTALAKLDYTLLNSVAKDNFVTYKQLVGELATILNSVTNNITTPEQDKQIGEIYAKIDELTDKFDDEGNPKVGEDLTKAELLQKYITSVRQVKEMFMDKKQKETFDIKLNNALDVIKKYETRDAAGRLIVDMNELMKVDEYRQAKNWLRRNTSYVLNNHDFEDFKWAFDILHDPNKRGSVLNTIVKTPGIKDEFGVIDGRKISDEDIAKIKTEVLKNYAYFRGNGLPYGGLIRPIDDSPVIYRRDFYSSLSGNSTKTEEEIALGEAINHILEPHFTELRDIDYSTLPVEDLEGEYGLIAYYAAYKGEAANRTSTKAKSIAIFIDEECNVTYNWDKYNRDAFNAKQKGNDYYQVWRKVFEEEIINPDTGEVIVQPNKDFYGIIKPKDESRWIDQERTDAVNILRNRTVEDTTQYYHIKKNEMLDIYGYNSPEYRKWFLDNHYYEPYERRFKPLRIWTNMRFVKEDGKELAGTFEPKINQMDIAIKPELINQDYAKSGISRYKVGTGYDNVDYIALNDYHHELIKVLNDTMQKYVYTNSNQRFVDKGYLPAAPKGEELNWKKIAKMPIDFIGLTWQTIDNNGWISDDKMTWENDYDIPNKMLKEFMDKNQPKRIPIPEKLETESEADYRRKVDDIYKQNAKIDADNRKYHADRVNNDWAEIMKAFITYSSRYNNIRLMKSLLYTTEHLTREMKAVEISGGSPKLDRAASVGNETAYRTTTQARTNSQLKEYMRRVVFEQFKENPNTGLYKLGSLAQNIAGSKYMMMNITGGIANVLTGSSNIMMERLAREYVNLSDWEHGKAEWLKGTVSYMANMYSDKSSSIQDGIIKLCKVVDYDRLLELNDSQGIQLAIQRLRGLMFSPQAMGEHFMQNTMLFAMMKSHRLKTDNEGKVHIISKEMHHRDAELNATKTIIGTNEELLNQWNAFLDTIKGDVKLKTKYDLFKAYPIQDFVKTHFDDNQIKAFIAKRKELIKEANNTFEILPKLYDQFELVDGYARVKADSGVNNEMLANFIEKVKRVNNKVHGVYDKIGAARIENQWWGGMVMQYHKHLYPGFKKRYRWNGYYNEALDTIEKGAYKSLWDFVTTPLRDVQANDDPAFVSIKAAQNYFIATYDFWRHAVTNYQLLPENERANIRRCWADILYVGAAIMGALATVGLGGDDEDDIFYNLCLYHADRLASEAASFTPIGAYAEAEKLWSSPIAIIQSGTDLLTTVGNTVAYIFDEDFSAEYTTGRYKGQNKFKVMMIRNIPVVRSINRLIDMPNNNSYYKLNENMLSIIPYKEWADILFD